MPTQDYIRMKINQYIYLFNRYNVYGLIALFALGMYLGLFQVPSGSRFGGALTITLCVALACVLSVIVKTVLKVTCGFTDVCECRMHNDKEYRNPTMYTCPPEDLQSVWRDVQFVIEDFGMNALYRYNLMTPLLFPIVSLSCSLITFDPSKLGLYVFVALLSLFVITKMVINFFFVVQGFCPCDCDNTDDCPPEYGGTAAMTPAAPSAPATPDAPDPGVPTDPGAQEGPETPQNGTSEDAILSEIDREVQDELKRMNAGADDDRLQAVCKVVTEKLQRYDTVDACVEEVMADDSVKSMVKTLLADDPTYQCLTSSTSDVQLSGCIRDFLSRKPQYMLRIMNVLPSGASSQTQ
jgi:hypothetical protein